MKVVCETEQQQRFLRYKYKKEDILLGSGVSSCLSKAHTLLTNGEEVLLVLNPEHKNESDYVDAFLKPYGDKFKVIYSVQPLGDEGYIGEEMLDKSPEGILKDRCEVIKETVESRVFSLEEALKVYKVSIEDYNNFLEK